ncbi:MAG TPA: sulfite exporter TauE/SafE family protein [Bryobacteraceae bacterium]|nr:sulfite exporter TauE/SafE family protein [Bryobacteraceae bacterium]
MSQPSLLSWLVLLAAAALGGAANALAGGGTFLTFPALLFAGVPPVISNATSTFVLNPAGYASTWVYRDRLIHGWGFQIAMAAVAMIGALFGSQLLLHTSEQSFQRLVPLLMLAATLIFTFSGWLRRAASRHAAKATHLAPLLAGQFIVAVYGGYFGAGMGVLTLVLYTVAANMDVHEASGLRILCGTLTNTVAIVLFALRGIIVWRMGLPMMLACIAGGYWGARLVKRLEAEKARKTILVYAWAVTAWLFIRSIHSF